MKVLTPGPADLDLAYDRKARSEHLAEIQAGDNWQAQMAKYRQLKGHFREFKSLTATLVYRLARIKQATGDSEIGDLVVALESHGIHADNLSIAYQFEQGQLNALPPPRSWRKLVAAVKWWWK